MDWAPWCLWAGLVLNLAGTLWGGGVILDGYQKARGYLPWVPAWRAFTAWLARLISWRRSAQTQVHPVSGTAHVSTSVSATFRVLPHGDTERLVAWLVDEVGRLHDQMVAVDRTRASDVQTLNDALETVRLGAADDVEGVRAEMVTLATDSVPVQVWCLVLIGVGSIVGALPSVAHW